MGHEPARLVASLKRSVEGYQGAVLDDANLVGEHVHVESLYGVGGLRAAYAKRKMRFQSFFMSTTVQSEATPPA